MHLYVIGCSTAFRFTRRDSEVAYCRNTGNMYRHGCAGVTYGEIGINRLYANGVVSGSDTRRFAEYQCIYGASGLRSATTRQGNDKRVRSTFCHDVRQSDLRDISIEGVYRCETDLRLRMNGYEERVMYVNTAFNRVCTHRHERSVR